MVLYVIEVIFQIRVTVLDVVSKSDVVLTMARRSRAIVNATWDLETKSKALIKRERKSSQVFACACLCLV